MWFKTEDALTYRSPTGEFGLPALNLQRWDFFFAIAFLMGLYALHRLGMIRETGEAQERSFIQDLFAQVRIQVRRVC